MLTFLDHVLWQITELAENFPADPEDDYKHHGVEKVRIHYIPYKLKAGLLFSRKFQKYMLKIAERFIMWSTWKLETG